MLVPPVIANESFSLSAVVVPVSAVNVLNASGCSADIPPPETTFQEVPSQIHVVVPSVNVSSTFGVTGKFNAITSLH